MLVFYPVGASNSHHGSRKFPVSAILVGEFGGIKNPANLFIAFIIIAP